MCPLEALYVKDEPLNIIAFLISGASKGISSSGQHVDICSALKKKKKVLPLCYWTAQLA